jgi:hypothetical protein
MPPLFQHLVDRLVHSHEEGPAIADQEHFVAGRFAALARTFRVEQEKEAGEEQ